MKINILGNGSFGSFLKKELPNYGFKIVDDDIYPVIFAIPFSAYEAEAFKCRDRYIINVCSVQKPSTDILLKHTDRVTSLHPLFGARTPENKRNSIVTYEYTDPYNAKWEDEKQFLALFGKFSNLMYVDYSLYPNLDDFFPKFTPESHDQLMAKTHAAAVLAAKQAKQAKHFVDAADDIPDELIPNSFRLLREFVKTLEDMPSGTIESIMANPYI